MTSYYGIEAFDKLPYMTTYASFLREVRGNGPLTVRAKLLQVYGFIDWLMHSQGPVEIDQVVEDMQWQYLMGQDDNYLQSQETLITNVASCSANDIRRYLEYYLEPAFPECQHDRVKENTLRTVRAAIVHFYDMLLANGVRQRATSATYRDNPARRGLA